MIKELYHLTPKENAESILKNGLQVKFCDLESVSHLRYDLLHYDDQRYRLKDAKKDVGTKGFIFASEELRSNSFCVDDGYCVIKIKGESVKKFYKDSIAMFEEYVCDEDIPACDLELISPKEVEQIEKREYGHI